MYAIVEIGGKQHKVSEGDVIYVEKLELADGESMSFDKVFAVNNGTDLAIGAPYVSGASVTAKAVKTGRGKKILIFKYNPKKGYRKRQGHRQPYTKIEIQSIKA